MIRISGSGGGSRWAEAQIIAALKQVEAGRTVDDVARECGVSQATIYTWKAKFDGMDVSEAHRLRIWFITAVRLATQRSRTRCNACKSN